MESQVETLTKPIESDILQIMSKPILKMLSIALKRARTRRDGNSRLGARAVSVAVYFPSARAAGGETDMPAHRSALKAHEKIAEKQCGAPARAPGEFRCAQTRVICTLSLVTKTGADADVTASLQPIISPSLFLLAEMARRRCFRGGFFTCFALGGDGASVSGRGSANR